jgi:ribosomal protein S18 acetylase RimI-like enzyme
MNPVQFRVYLEWAIPNYAQELVRSGQASSESALIKADTQFGELLPHGLATEGQYPCLVLDSDRSIQVGYLWWGIRRDEDRRHALLCDFVIFEPFRRQGYGRRALARWETEVKQAGLETMILSVFAHNASARALYAGAGFGVARDLDSHLLMAKKVGARDRSQSTEGAGG